MDDLFEKKKEAAEVLDLSKLCITSQEDFRAAVEKVPDFKIKQVKVRSEEIKIKDGADEQKFKIGKKEFRSYERLGTRGYEEKHFTFMDPVPGEMQSLKLQDLYTVPIDWKMLTSLRPKAKVDEDFFTRLIELGKSELRTLARDRRDLTMNSSVRKSKNRAGVLETRVVSCQECGEEFCDGKFCAPNNYEAFARVHIHTERKISKQSAGGGGEGARGRRVRRGRRSKSVGGKGGKRRGGSKAGGGKSDTEL